MGESMTTVRSSPVCPAAACRSPSTRHDDTELVREGAMLAEHDVPDPRLMGNLVTVQTSATSQSPAAGRHSVFAATNVQLAVQQVPVGSAPTSHCSPGSRTPSPQ